MELTKPVKSNTSNSNNCYFNKPVWKYMCLGFFGEERIKMGTILMKIPNLNTKSTSPFNSFMNFNNYFYPHLVKFYRKSSPFISKIGAYLVHGTFGGGSRFSWTNFCLIAKGDMLNINTNRIWGRFITSK